MMGRIHMARWHQFESVNFDSTIFVLGKLRSISDKAARHVGAVVHIESI